MAKAERIASWMRQQMAAAGARGFVVGLSGGIDSAVVARLAQLAAPGATVGVILPSHSDPQDERDAELLAAHFSLATTRVNLSSVYDAVVAGVERALDELPRDAVGASPSKALGSGTASQDKDAALANIKPRLRMTALYAVAGRLNYLVAGTGNRSEIAVGYFTKHGDGAADLLPIGHLVKSDVLALARDLNIPSSIIERKPSAGLRAGQSDEDEMGFSYAELERYLDEGPQGVAPAVAMRIERMVRSSEHKRALPPTPDF